MTQFTASEVRTESCKQGQLHRQPASDMLNAFADMLEAREKAVPVAWSLIFEESIGVNAPTTFDRREYAEDYADACAMPNKCNPFPHRPKVVPLYTHPAPADAERLAEALRKIVEWQPPYVISSNGGRSPMQVEFGSNGVRDYFRRIAEEALAAHSAQAQPPAASVTDAMVNAAMRADFCGHNVADALMCGTDWNTEVMRAALEAALAAQVNPNG